MRISILGLGYVRYVSADCLSSKEYQVIGVNVNPIKVNEINSGMSAVLEKRI